MAERVRNWHWLLLGLCLAHLAWFVLAHASESATISGVLYADTRPVGGDFINLWTAARLTLARLFGDIYQPDAFMGAEIAVTGRPIGLRLWAYPPHSLLFAWPAGLAGFYPALMLWTLLGLGVLWFGARRFGFDRLEATILLLSPATVLNAYYGQTGSLACGLALLALSVRHDKDLLPPIAAAILTIKPQAGFLLPLLWAIERRWRVIAVTGVLVLGLVAASVALFRLDAWRDWLGATLPLLSQLERHGSGPFMSMIPSAFMSFRIWLDDGDLALKLHLIVALCVGAYLVVRLLRTREAPRRAALVLLGGALMTPYLHNYDLGLVLAGALLVLRHGPARAVSLVGRGALLVAAWALPHLVVGLNLSGVPLSPLIMALLLLLA